MTTNQNTGDHVSAIEFEAIEFTEMPTSIVVDAVREYEKAQTALRTEAGSSHDLVWSSLAHQVVGHEVGL